MNAQEHKDFLQIQQLIHASYNALLVLMEIHRLGNAKRVVLIQHLAINLRYQELAFKNVLHLILPLSVKEYVFKTAIQVSLEIQ